MRPLQALRGDSGTSPPELVALAHTLHDRKHWQGRRILRQSPLHRDLARGSTACMWANDACRGKTNYLGAYGYILPLRKWAQKDYPSRFHVSIYGASRYTFRTKLALEAGGLIPIYSESRNIWYSWTLNPFFRVHAVLRGRFIISPKP